MVIDHAFSRGQKEPAGQTAVPCACWITDPQQKNDFNKKRQDVLLHRIHTFRDTKGNSVELIFYQDKKRNTINLTKLSNPFPSSIRSSLHIDTAVGSLSFSKR